MATIRTREVTVAGTAYRLVYEGPSIVCIQKRVTANGRTGWDDVERPEFERVLAQVEAPNYKYGTWTTRGGPTWRQ